MYCLRCGRDTTEDHVFCDACQANMELYPVKPGTAIHLPHKKELPAVKKRNRRKKQYSPDEQIALLRRALRQARVFLVLLSIVLCLAVAMLLRQTLELEDTNIGRNYTIDTTQETD